jgi:hypothetical protein
MNNDLIARRLKPPTPAAAPLSSGTGPPPPAPPPFAPQPAPYAPQSTPFERSDIPWDRPVEPEPAVDQDSPPTLESAVELPPTVELDAAAADLELPVEPEATAEPMLPAQAKAEATAEPMLSAQPETTDELDAPDSVAFITPRPQTVAELLAEAATRFSGHEDALTTDAAVAFVPDAEFVSVVPPWESPPDEAWLIDEWASGGSALVDVEADGEPAISAAAPHTAEPEPVEPEPQPSIEMADEAAPEFTTEAPAEPAAELVESAAEPAAEPLAEAFARDDEVGDAPASLDLRLPDIGSWAPHAPDTDSALGDLPPDGNTVVADATVVADPNDVFAPIAEDLLTANTVAQPPEWPERDLSAPMLVSHEPDETDQFAQFATAAQDAEIAGAHPDTQAVVDEPLLAWEPAPAGPSVFGEMLAAVDPPLADQPLPSVAAVSGQTPEPIQPEAFAVAQPEPPAPPPSPVDWPPVPTGVFPPLPDALPTLNVESAPDDAIEWPDDPRPQTFWPAEAPTVHADPTSDDAWVAAPPLLAADAQPVEPELRYVPPPPGLVLGVGTAEERPRLVFSDPLLPSAEGDGRDGVLTRIGNQATAFAERLPDGWSLPSAPTLTSTSEKAMARDLKDIQSPTLTVLFAIVAIAAVLLFVYLVTPLLR